MSPYNMRDFLRVADANRRASYQECKTNDEYFSGRSIRESGIRGLEAKAKEIARKIVAEENSKYPDAGRLERLRLIQENLRITLSKCR